MCIRDSNKLALVEKNDISTLPVDSIYTPVLKANYTAVSYTHLDVYKRQSTPR